MFSNHSDHELRDIPSWQRPAPKRTIFVRRTPAVRPNLITAFCLTIIFALIF